MPTPKRQHFVPKMLLNGIISARGEKDPFIEIGLSKLALPGKTSDVDPA